MTELYAAAILEHARNPLNSADLSDDADIELENQLCGDVLRLRVDMSKPGLIESAYFDGHACAATIASASMMTSQIRGMTPKQALRLKAEFFSLLEGGSGEGLSPELNSFRCVARSNRVKCAMLPWEALESILAVWR